MPRLRPPSPICLSFLALIALAGCGSQTGSAPSTTPTVVAAASAGLQAEVASSDLAAGPNRFTFGLLNNNHPLENVTPRVVFYAIQGNTATPMAATIAHFNHFAQGLRHTEANQTAIEIGGVYVTHVNFRTPGNWGAEIRFRYHGKAEVLRSGFYVRAHSLTPPVGSPAPRSNNPTVAQMPATKLDSGRPPDDMHRLSIAQAIARHKPLLVLFATAGYCTSRMCGPEIEVVQGLENRYRGRVNFVHIEIYKNANPQYGYAPTVVQWHLQTEPWVFVVNRRGIITAKFEGPTPAREIQPALQAVLRT